MKMKRTRTMTWLASGASSVTKISPAMMSKLPSHSCSCVCVGDLVKGKSRNIEVKTLVVLRLFNVTFSFLSQIFIPKSSLHYLLS